MQENYDLRRFVSAQESIYAQVCNELRQGQKQSHWMWFIFPQLRGLGQSTMALRYGIESREEAQAYLAHPVLGTRLMECTGLVNAVKRRSAEAIFGYPDDLKFRSCVTLFSRIAPEEPAFRTALERFYEGAEDELTVRRLMTA